MDPIIKIKLFKKVILAVCKAFELSISHEDDHGAFMIVPFDDTHVDWFEAAFIKDIPGSDNYDDVCD
jgi:hypothetical protein